MHFQFFQPHVKNVKNATRAKSWSAEFYEKILQNFQRTKRVITNKLFDSCDSTKF